jgi:Mg2+ and Co2+ transporter CorA
MEQTNTSLFSLSNDPVTKAHLYETAKWAKFLAVVGMIFLVLMIVAGVFGSAMLFSTMGGLDNEYGGTGMATYGSGIFATYMIVVAVIYFFPLLFTLRFANKMRAALNGNDQQALNTSFQNLKACFRYIGIITIIALVFLAIGLVFGIMGAAAFS